MDRRELLKMATGGVVPLLAAETLAGDGKSVGEAAAPSATVPADAGQWPPKATPGRARQWLKTALEPGDFVMAYYLRQVAPEDGRPPLPGDPFGPSGGSEEPGIPGDPFAPAGKGKDAGEASAYARKPSHRVLNGSPGLIDVAAVISRMKKQARVEEKDAVGLMTALLDSPELLNMSDCYEPRHLVVFYDGLGSPKAVVEVCFSCESYRVHPTDDPHSPYTGDLLVAARLFDKLGLPLREGGYSLKDYEKRLMESRARLQRSMKESAAGRK